MEAGVLFTAVLRLLGILSWPGGCSAHQYQLSAPRGQIQYVVRRVDFFIPGVTMRRNNIENLFCKSVIKLPQALLLSNKMRDYSFQKSPGCRAMICRRKALVLCAQALVL